MAQRLWILREAPNDSADPRTVALYCSSPRMSSVIIMAVVEWRQGEEGLDCEIVRSVT